MIFTEKDLIIVRIDDKSFPVLVEEVAIIPNTVQGQSILYFIYDTNTKIMKILMYGAPEK